MAEAGKRLATDETLDKLAKDSTLDTLGKDTTLARIAAAILNLPNATQAAADNATAAAAAARAAISDLGGLIAPTYSASSTYSVGQYVYYNSRIYRCVSAISTPEEWTAGHWKEVPIGNDVSDLKSALNTNSERSLAHVGLSSNNLIDYENIFDGKYVRYNVGDFVNSSEMFTTDYMRVLPGEQLYVSHANQCAFYTYEKTYVSGKILNGDVDEILEIPRANTIAFVLISFYKDHFANTKVSMGKSLGNDQYATKKELASLSGFISDNIINLNEVIDDKYVTYRDGEIRNSSGYSVTGFMPVIPGATYRVTGFASGSQVAFYDKAFAYIDGYASDVSPEIKVPNNANIQYARWCSTTANKSSFSIVITPITQKTIRVQSTDSLLDKIIEAYSVGATNVIVEAGTYDLIEEYKNTFGSDYWTSYTDNYNGLSNGYYDRGIWLENIKITFAPGAYVVCDYKGDNSYVKEYFSPFAPGADAEIEGLNLYARELRYGLHPDFNPNNRYSKFVMRNCDIDFKKGNDNFQAVGAGLGISCDWLFENCIFRSPSTGEGLVFRVHNNAYEGAKSNIVFRNCYVVGIGEIGIRWYGDSQEITNVMICGCSYITKPTLKAEVAGQPYENMKIMFFGGNEQRESD